MAEPAYEVLIKTGGDAAFQGAVWVEPHWRFGSYAHYWEQVANLSPQEGRPAVHDAMLAQYEYELAGAGGWRAEELTQRVAEFRAYRAMLAATAPVAAAKFDQMADLGIEIPHFGAGGAYQPHPAHQAARNGQGKAG